MRLPKEEWHWYDQTWKFYGAVQLLELEEQFCRFYFQHYEIKVAGRHITLQALEQKTLIVEVDELTHVSIERCE